MSLEDNFFGCAETPLWIPPTFEKSQLQVCRSCTLRLTAKIPGPGNCIFTDEHIIINENPTTTLTINGIQYNLVGTLLKFPGLHRLFGQQVPSDAEMVCEFKHTRDPSISILLTLPVDIGEGSTNPYFSTLGTGVTPNRPTFASLFSEDSDFLSYKGASIFQRSHIRPRPREECDPVKTVYTYYVCLTPANIRAKDFERLYALSNTKNSVQPPKPLTDVKQDRLLKLGTLIQGLRIETSEKTSSDGSISTSAMKCYRLNPEKDIVQNRVYVGGKKRPGDRTLAKELERAASDMSLPDHESSIQPGDIERVIGIVLGVTIGLVVCATIAVLMWNGTFTNYLNAQKLYNTPLSASKLSLFAKFPPLPRVCPK